MALRERALLWWIAVAMTSIGVGAILAGASWGPLAAIGGVVTLANIAWTMFPGRRIPSHVAALGLAGGFLAILSALALQLDLRVRLAMVILGIQLQLAAAAATRDPLIDRASSFLVSALGHATALLGVSLLLVGRDVLDVAAIVCAGVSVLLVHAFWRQRVRGGPGEEWEALFLLGVVLFVASPIVARFLPAAPSTLVLGAGLLAALFCLAVLALPPRAVSRVARRPGAAGRAMAHGVTFIVVFNALLLAYSLVTVATIRVVVALSSSGSWRASRSSIARSSPRDGACATDRRSRRSARTRSRWSSSRRTRPDICAPRSNATWSCPSRSTSSSCPRRDRSTTPSM